MAEKPTPEEIVDGFALWQEHQPQTGEDWVAVAERFIAAGETTENSSPLFAALVLAVAERDRCREGIVEALYCLTLIGHNRKHGRGEGWPAKAQAATETLYAALQSGEKA
jgi:hypothetical protein